MDLKASLLAVAETFCRAKPMSKARLATKLVNDGKFFSRIEVPENGFTVSTYEKCMRLMSAEWPSGATWPANVPRPAASDLPLNPPVHRRLRDRASCKAPAS